MFNPAVALFIVAVLAAYIVGRVALDIWNWREVFAAGWGASRDRADEVADRLRAEGIHARVVTTGRGIAVRYGRPGAPDLSEGYSVRVGRRDAARALAIVETMREEREA